MSTTTHLSDEYFEYLASEGWQARRRGALLAAQNRCQICNAAGSLDVHHRTYARFGNEDLSDLTVLCRACHELFHTAKRQKAAKPTKQAKRKLTKSKRQRQSKKLAQSAPSRKELAAIAAENNRLHKVQQNNKLKLAREGKVTPVLRAGLAGRTRI